jgi:pimeloyl-ACP methyl ester carboxylesterase
VRGSVIAPSAPTEPFVWCCLPGGHCTSDYFDLVVDGDDTSYSMAAYLADAGGVVLTLDHLGSGASSAVDDNFLLTPDVVAAANHAAFTTLLDRLRTGDLVPELPAVRSFAPIGLGHSMGGMLTMVQQARHRTYDAVVNLGSGGDGFPEHLRDPSWVSAELSTVRASLVDLARVQFSAPPPAGGRALPFHADDVPAAVRASFRRQLTNMLPTCAFAAILPSGTDPERAAVTVPIFLGFGEHDLCADVHAAVSRYRSSSDITLTVLAGSGHCHNQAGNRRRLWERMSAWARSAQLTAHDDGYPDARDEETDNRGPTPARRRITTA